jgi:hypothetical protein
VKKRAASQARGLPPPGQREVAGIHGSDSQTVIVSGERSRKARRSRGKTSCSLM